MQIPNAWRRERGGVAVSLFNKLQNEMDVGQGIGELAMGLSCDLVSDFMSRELARGQGWEGWKTG